MLYIIGFKVRSLYIKGIALFASLFVFDWNTTYFLGIIFRCEATLWTANVCICDICPGKICPGDLCPYLQYFKCYRLDFDETSKLGYWEYLEPIPTVMMIFVSVIFVLSTFVHIRNISAVRISQLLLTKFLPNFFSPTVFSCKATLWTAHVCISIYLYVHFKWYSLCLNLKMH